MCITAITLLPQEADPSFEKFFMDPSTAPPLTGTTANIVPPATSAAALALDPTAGSANPICAVEGPDSYANDVQFLMAEQHQPESPSHPLSLAQLQQLEAPLVAPQAALTIYEPVMLPTPIHPPSAKLHPRPRKIRKLSSDTAAAGAGDSSSSSVVVAFEPDPTKLTSAAPRNVRSRAIASHTARVQPAFFRTRSLATEGEVDIAIRHLRNADPHLARLIDLHPPPNFESFQPPFLALTRSILYQQLAYKAGASIYERFLALCGGESGVLPDTIISLMPQQLRQIGVSSRKASYLHDLARKYQNGILSDSSIMNMDDKSLFTMLTMVNGIGSWSVHMFMIFSLHRPDVLPVNDLQVRKGVQLLYGLPELPRPSQMDKLCEKWRPYRSVASWYLWRFSDAKGSPLSSNAVANTGSGLLQQPQQQQQHQQQQQQQQQHQQQMLTMQQQLSTQYIPPLPGMDMRACAWGQSLT